MPIVRRSLEAGHGHVDPVHHGLLRLHHVSSLVGELNKALREHAVPRLSITVVGLGEWPPLVWESHFGIRFERLAAAGRAGKLTELLRALERREVAPDFC